MLTNIDSVFCEYVLKATQGIRNSKLRPNNHTIFDYVTKNFADASLIDATIQILLKSNLIENRPTNKGDPFFIKHTSSDFHEVSCMEKTNNFETLAQATQTSALMNHSYVSNDVFDAFYVDYIEFKKYVDDIINSLNAKNEVCEKSVSNNDHSKLKVLEAEILKLRNKNTSLKYDNKSKLKIIESLTTCQRSCTIISNEKLHVKPLSFQNTQTRNNWKQVKQNRPFPRHDTENRNIISSNFFESLYVEDITSNNSKNPDFVVTPSAQTTILTSNPRPNLMPAQNHSRRPNICTTKNYLRNYNPPAVPGNSSYATVSKFGKKIFVVGDSHVKRMKHLDFNKELHSGTAFSRSFSGANSKQLDHYIIPTLVDDKPDVALLLVGTNYIPSKANDTELSNNIINIGLN